MKNVDQMKEIVSANKRRELIPAFLSLIETEWPSVLPFVKRQLQDSFFGEENTVSSTYFLLVEGEPAGLIQTSGSNWGERDSIPLILHRII